MLADNMKAYEYFKYLIEVKEENPLQAFEEVLNFIEVHDYKTQEAVQEVEQDTERKIVLSNVNLLYQIVDFFEEKANQMAMKHEITVEEIEGICTCEECREKSSEEYEDWFLDDEDE